MRSYLLKWTAALALVAAATGPVNAQPVQRVYVFPQQVEVNPKKGGTVYGMCLDKNVVGAPKSKDKIELWTTPEQVVIVRQTTGKDGKKTESEQKWSDVLDKKVQDPWVDFTGASDLPPYGVNLRVRLLAKPEDGVRYFVKIEKGLAVARKTEPIDAPLLKKLKETEKTLAPVDTELARIRTAFGDDTPFRRLVEAYAQEHVYWALDGDAVKYAERLTRFSEDFAKEINAVPEGRRLLYATFLCGDLSKTGRMKLVTDLGVKLPAGDPLAPELVRAAEQLQSAFLLHRRDAQRLITDRKTADPGKLPQLQLARDVLDIIAARHRSDLHLGDAAAYRHALLVLGTKPAKLVKPDGALTLTHPEAEKALPLDDILNAIQSASEGVKKADPKEIVKALDEVVKVIGNSGNDRDLDVAVLAAKSARELFASAKDGKVANDLLNPAGFDLLVTVAALERTKVAVPAKLLAAARPLPKAPALPADWVLLVTGMRPGAPTNPVGLTGQVPFIIRIDALEPADQRVAATKLARFEDATGVPVVLAHRDDSGRRAAVLRFGQSVAVTADKTLVAIVAETVNKEKFEIGKECFDNLNTLAKLIKRVNTAAKKPEERIDVEIRVAHTDKNETILKTWTDEAKEGKFAGKHVILVFCPTKDPKAQRELMAKLLDPAFGKAESVVMSNTTKLHVPAFALSIQLLAELPTELRRQWTPAQMLAATSRLALAGLEKCRVEKDAEKREALIEKMFPLASPKVRDYLEAVLQDEEKYKDLTDSLRKQRQLINTHTALPTRLPEVA